MLFQTVFGMLSGIVLTPLLGFLWVLLPMLVLGALTYIRKQKELEVGLPAETWFILAIAILVYMGEKFMTLPGITRYVPFSAWLPIANWMKVPLQIIVPIIITLISIRISKRFTLRPGSQSPLYFLLLFIGIDALLTTAIYGLLFYNLV